jgi:O-antigen ligase/polysaccharide polymerase Wzy-like membrane protein
LILLISLNLFVIATLFVVARTKGFDRALALAAFFLVLFPEETKLSFPGLFDLTTQRLVTMALLVLSFAVPRPQGAPRNLPLKTAVIALCGWWLLSAVNSIVFWASLKSVLSQIFDYYIVYYIFVRNVSSTATVRRILFGIVAGLTVCSFFGILEAYAQWTVISALPPVMHRYGMSGGLYIDPTRGLRVYSTFGHPILFGCALAMGIPIALYLVTVTKVRAQKAFLWIGIMMMFLAIYKTSSRGPWMALGMSLATMLFLSRVKLKKYLTVLALLAVTILIARPGIWETIFNNYLGTVNTHTEEGESYVYRYVLYDLVMQELNRSLPRGLWGYGPQSFPFLNLHGEIHGRPMNFTSCDSSFAAFLAETGYIGFIITVLPLVMVFKYVVRSYRSIPSPYNQLCLVFLVNLGAFYFEMGSVYLFGWGQQTIMLWVVIALAMVYPSLLISERRILAGKAESRDAAPVSLAGFGLNGERLA